MLEEPHARTTRSSSERPDDARTKTHACPAPSATDDQGIDRPYPLTLRADDERIDLELADAGCREEPVTEGDCGIHQGVDVRRRLAAESVQQRPQLELAQRGAHLLGRDGKRQVRHVTVQLDGNAA